MIHVNVFVTSISAERFWEVERQLPFQFQINVNINVLDVQQNADGSLDAPFIFTINFTPSVAQISIKGKARVSGEADETKKIFDDHKTQKQPPVAVVQAVSNVAIVDAILVSRTLNIPPPLPPLMQPQAQQAPPKTDTRYTA